MYVKVTVHAGARKERVEKIPKGFIIHVKEPAQRNLANRKVAELLARELGVPESAVRLVSGHRSPSKIFSVPVLD